ncbi:hypothetical protein KSP39_PZI013822 [Platanthera zijinensis]|uniref:Uncharacterized protein n=1 Tax=Platanthera zijinensis TaxID=2320716 RepID=A0AAP0BDY2_9ASPA
MVGRSARGQQQIKLFFFLLFTLTGMDWSLRNLAKRFSSVRLDPAGTAPSPILKHSLYIPLLSLSTHDTQIKKPTPPNTTSLPPKAQKPHTPSIPPTSGSCNK